VRTVAGVRREKRGARHHDARYTRAPPAATCTAPFRAMYSFRRPAVVMPFHDHISCKTRSTRASPRLLTKEVSF
jgi:hypothetical protein